jgi:bifunctional non-homologous end joining protein LigD
MLASSAAPARGWPADAVVQPKLDGYRCIISVADGWWSARSRNGSDFTDALPEVARVAETGTAAVLDCELIVGAGRVADFTSLAGRMAGRPRAGSPTVSAVAFDVMWQDGQDLCGLPHAERRAHLEALELGPVQVMPEYELGMLDVLLAACEELGGEGVVVKAGTYQPGKRSKSWVKVKCPTAKAAIALRMENARR